MRNLILVAITGMLAASVLGSVVAGEKPSAFECTVSSATCGGVVTTATETSVCGIAEIAKIGNLPNKAYLQVTFFAGYRIGGEVLFLGGGSLKGGILLSCKVPVLPDSESPDFKKLKSQLPELLLKNAEIRKALPGIRRVELDKAFVLDKLSPEAKKKVFEKYKR